ncbi:ceramidase domain-containing protein [Halocynthiibacter sp. C4]|uniref:ceramidase domain-containing protein n=1 Tax=Halocynthiibacter sp. C4 TaxID=2992758 RepID=UPI00237C083B|nr:ceramidase domain-containing protein [Halocynthiibacter sp. C4]MDE0590241.1 ceramidase domain-containing protein [Halocynthiibacter sp. C4]
MDWTEQFNDYCERLGPEFWAEPINAVTNLAFVLMGLLAWRASTLPLSRLLSAELIIIGVGSFLFHTFATAWASMADVIPILIFILTYVYLANAEYLGWPKWMALLGVVGFFPYAIGVSWLLGQIAPGLGANAIYGSVAILIALYGLILWQKQHQTAQGLLIGAGLLTVSITLRALDEPLCGSIPFGTHFLWHILNALMLGHMIRTYVRHKAASGLAGGASAG